MSGSRVRQRQQERTCFAWMYVWVVCPLFELLCAVDELTRLARLRSGDGVGTLHGISVKYVGALFEWLGCPAPVTGAPFAAGS